MKRLAPKKILVLLIAVAGLSSLTGCKTTEGDDLSARPWSQPRGWESGVPGFIQNDRYR